MPRGVYTDPEADAARRERVRILGAGAGERWKARHAASKARASISAENTKAAKNSRADQLLRKFD